MCKIFRLLIIVCYGREIKCVKNKNLLKKKRVTNDCLLWEKDNTLNLLERESVSINIGIGW